MIPRLISILKSNITALSASSSMMMTRGAATSTNNAATNKELNNINDPIHSFLTAHWLQVSSATAWRWMRLLGFHYDTRKKSFYVDGHECEDVVANCTAFCKAYLTENKPYCCRWVQISKEDTIKIKNLDIGFGYHFHNIIAGADCVEFHVNYWNGLTAEKQTTAAGGPASVVPINKPTMSIRVLSKAKPS